MKVYFVRHGEGEHNVKKLYSIRDFSLTEKGKKQAEFVAQRIKDLPIDLIVTSSYKRTLQTTEIINRNLNKKVEITDLAIEIIRPKEIAGKSMEDPENKAIRKQIDENFHLQNWHYSDEENFFDLQERTFKFIEFLENLKYETILVISHIHFIRMVVLTMMLRENLTPKIFLRSLGFLELETSGLTVCEKYKDWKLITWNDHAHLANGNTNLGQG